MSRVERSIKRLEFSVSRVQTNPGDQDGVFLSVDVFVNRRKKEGWYGKTTYYFTSSQANVSDAYPPHMSGVQIDSLEWCERWRAKRSYWAWKLHSKQVVGGAVQFQRGFLLEQAIGDVVVNVSGCNLADFILRLREQGAVQVSPPGTASKTVLLVGENFPVEIEFEGAVEDEQLA